VEVIGTRTSRRLKYGGANMKRIYEKEPESCGGLRHHVWMALLTMVLLGIVWLPEPPVSAQLPPRPEPRQPTARPPKLYGAIELHVTSAQPGLWIVVQWQDAFGDWHDVEGWQGTLDEGDLKTWWVDEDDLGKGPFRWDLRQGIGGASVAVSESFYLPQSNGQVVKVEVSLEP
jgi:hypothetical protein